MRVVSVNVGKITNRPWRNGTHSAIHKSALDTPVFLNQNGLEGDEQSDLKNHGGEDKAVLVLPSSAYVRFEISHPYGFLGENLSIEGIDETEICLGDRLQIGSILLEVSQPRSPCWKLDAHVGEDSKWQKGEFLKAYSESGHIGFYCRVLANGHIKKGQQVIWLTRNSDKTQYPRVTIRELFLAKQFGKGQNAKELLRNALKHPALSKAWQKTLLGML